MFTKEGLRRQSFGLPVSAIAPFSIRVQFAVSCPVPENKGIHLQMVSIFFQKFLFQVFKTCGWDKHRASPMHCLNLQPSSSASGCMLHAHDVCMFLVYVPCHVPCSTYMTSITGNPDGSSRSELERQEAWESKPDLVPRLWPCYIAHLHITRSIFSSWLSFSACPFAWRCNGHPCRTDITTAASNSIDEMPSLLKSKRFHSRDWYWQVTKQLTRFQKWPAQKETFTLLLSIFP